MTETRMVRRKIEAPEIVATEWTPQHWWDGHVNRHPMTDAEFVEAFCAHVLIGTDDFSLRALRNNAYRFIRNFMAKQLEQELTNYRKLHE